MRNLGGLMLCSAGRRRSWQRPSLNGRKSHRRVGEVRSEERHGKPVRRRRHRRKLHRQPMVILHIRRRRDSLRSWVESHRRCRCELVFTLSLCSLLFVLTFYSALSKTWFRAHSRQYFLTVYS